MRSIITLITLLIATCLNAQELKRFTVHNTVKFADAPVSIALDGMNYNTDDCALALYEVSGNSEKRIPVQLEAGHSARLWFIVEDVTPANTTRTYVLKQEQQEATRDSGHRLVRQHKDLSIVAGDRQVLKYRYATTYPPDGIHPLYKRSGFIHPLVSPAGEVLTRIQAPDHYHHYGIWGPWTLTHIGEREVDFWNLAKGEGTVRFAAFLSETEGEVFSGFKVLQQHIDFGASGEDQVAMNEVLDVRAWNAGSDIWIIDYTSTLNSPLPDGIMLNAYRYGGGIGFRATEKWQKDNSTVLTSEGKTRIDADGSNARWCIVEGESDTKDGRSGILFLSHPSNRMHPEPMRVWPLDANGGRGDMYFEFVPIRHNDWKLEKRTDYTLKYRMVVFDGEMDADSAEMYWNSFSQNQLQIATERE